MDKYLVYKHTNLHNGKVYIGITKNIVNPNLRWRNGFGYEENEQFFSDIVKYGWDNFTHEILISDLDYVEACQKEREYISYYDSANQGYNRSPGGNMISEEGRKKLSELHKGVPKSIESIQKQMDTKHERYGSGRGIEYIGTLNKKVRCKETGDVFISISDAARWCSSSKVGECCRGNRKTAGKHPITGQQLSWEYADDFAEITKCYDNEEINPFQNKKYVKKVRCIETNIVYESASAAARDTGICSSNILRVCKHERKTAGNLHWEFIIEECE